MATWDDVFREFPELLQGGPGDPPTKKNPHTAASGVSNVPAAQRQRVNAQVQRGLGAAGAALKDMAQHPIRTAVDFTPVIGDAKGLFEAGRDLAQGELTPMGGVLAATSALPFVPNLRPAAKAAGALDAPRLQRPAPVQRTPDPAYDPQNLDWSPQDAPDEGALFEAEIAQELESLPAPRAVAPGQERRGGGSLFSIGGRKPQVSDETFQRASAEAQRIAGLPVPHEKARAAATRSAGATFAQVPSEQFQAAVQAAADAQKGNVKAGEMLTVYSPEEYAEMRTFLSPDGKTGYAIKSDGDLVSVFNAGGRGAGADAVRSGIENGATKLDAFDDFLPAYYRQFGFEPTGTFANWEAGGTPVTYMEYRGGGEVGKYPDYQRLPAGFDGYREDEFRGLSADLFQGGAGDNVGGQLRPGGGGGAAVDPRKVRAAVKIKGKLFEGDTHADAVIQAEDDGWITPDEAERWFMRARGENEGFTINGEYLTRGQTKERLGVGEAYALQKQGKLIPPPPPEGTWGRVHWEKKFGEFDIGPEGAAGDNVGNQLRPANSPYSFDQGPRRFHGIFDPDAPKIQATAPPNPRLILPPAAGTRSPSALVEAVSSSRTVPQGLFADAEAGMGVGGPEWYELGPVKADLEERAARGEPVFGFGEMNMLGASSSASNSVAQEIAAMSLLNRNRRAGLDITGDPKLINDRFQAESGWDKRVSLMGMHGKGAEQAIQDGFTYLPEDMWGDKWKIPSYANMRMGGGGPVDVPSLFADGPVEIAPGQFLGSDEADLALRLGGLESPALDTHERRRIMQLIMQNPRLARIARQEGAVEAAAKDSGRLPVRNVKDYMMLSDMYRGGARAFGLPSAGAFQAARWLGGGVHTGLKSPPRGTFVDLLSDQIKYTAQALGRDDSPAGLRGLWGDVAAGRAYLLPWAKEGPVPLK